MDCNKTLEDVRDELYQLAHISIILDQLVQNKNKPVGDSYISDESIQFSLMHTEDRLLELAKTVDNVLLSL